jgi:methylglutaconyl-CoA hydratase
MTEERFETLEVHREADLLFVALAAPERANALSPRMVEELTGLYLRPWLDEGVRAVLLTGAGRHFSAGADLAHLERLQDAGYEENRQDSDRLRGLFEAVLRQDSLTLALVQGSCVAGGCGLATACDFVVAGEDARFLYSEVRIGFVAALVATFLPRRVRGSDLKELLLFPRFLDAGKAAAIGLVDRVVPAADLAAEGRMLAEAILANGSSSALAATKRLLLEVQGLSLGEALERAAEVNARARSTADCRRGIAHVLEHKAPPSWR